MTTKWFFYAGDKKAGKDLSYACKVLGKHRELIDSISNSLFKMRFSQKYSAIIKPNSSEDANKNDAGKERAKFEPEEGIELVDKIRNYITSNKKLYKGSFDFDLVIIDLDEVIKLMRKAKKENRKWYLAIGG